jgi:4-hydroxybenzoate polyprenyltransferase
MRSAGCAYNDIMDRDIDAKVARTAQRPLPSGQLSVRDAWSFLIACSLISFFVLATMNLTAILFGVLSLGLVAAYPFMKRITWWPQAWLGLTFNWGVLLGAAAASAGASGLMILTGRFLVATHAWLTFSFNPGRPPGLAAVLLYGSGVLWTLGYDTIYAVQDLEDDALVGVRSSARRLGPRVGRGVAVFYGLCLVLALAAGVLARLSVFYYPFWAAFSAHLLWQARRLRPNDPQGALALFRSNRTAGLILTLGLAAGGVPLRL